MEPGPMGTQIINDAYNANPMSVRQPPTPAAIPRAAGRRRIALLGDMLELGPTEIEQHRETIALAKSLDLDLLGLVGPRFEAACDDDTLWAAEAGVREKLRAHLQPGDIVLIKGSRGIKMERVLNGLEPKETVNAVPLAHPLAAEHHLQPVPYITFRTAWGW